MIKFNFFTGNFDFTGSQGGSSGPVIIPEYGADPVSPQQGEAWVLRGPALIGGNLLYFFGAMPVTEQEVCAFSLSIQTTEGIKRVSIT